MKYSAAAATLVLVSLLTLCGCLAMVGGDAKFEIKVSGDAAYSGAIMVTRAGKSENRSVEGRAPERYSETGTIVSVSFQKKDTRGTLQVEIFKNGTSVASQSTNAAYGVVSVAAGP